MGRSEWRLTRLGPHHSGVAMKSVIAAAAAFLMAGTALAAPHKCTADAIDRAGKLLRFFWEGDGLKLAAKPGEPDPNETGDVMNWSLDEEVKTLKPIADSDVLEVSAYVYKATYRIRILYLQGVDDCIPTGEEILAQ